MRALRHLQAAVKTRPADAAARNALGGLYLRVNRLAEAETELSEAARLEPKSPWPVYNLGLIASRKGDHRAAATQFRKALAVAPGFAPAQEALAKLQISK